MRASKWEGRKKVCAVCKIAKPPSEYWKDRSSPDGLQITCKGCWRDLKKARERVPRTRGKQLSLGENP